MNSADTRLGRELARMRRMEGVPFWTLLASASLTLGMGAGVVAKSVQAAPIASVHVDTGLVREALKLRLPKTRIGPIGGLTAATQRTSRFVIRIKRTLSRPGPAPGPHDSARRPTIAVRRTV